MSIWFFLWFALSAALLFFAGWTIYILYRQKESWRAFARKYKLRYNAKKNLTSPEVSGVFEGFTLTLFASEHVAADARARRKMTAIEINLTSKIPFSGSVGNGVMVGVIQGLSYKGEVAPPSAEWNSSYVARSSNTAAMEAYLTPERLEALTGLMKIKGVSAILIFEPGEALLRLDTPDPLDMLEKIEKLAKRLSRAAKTLELKDGEAARLAMITDKPKENIVKTLDAPSETGNLQLED